MIEKAHVSAQLPVLFYADRCGKCRILSWIVIKASLHLIQRIPMDSAAALDFYQQHPEARGQLVLFHPRFAEKKLAIGPWVYPLVPWVILRAWIAVAYAALALGGTAHADLENR